MSCSEEGGGGGGATLGSQENDVAVNGPSTKLREVMKMTWPSMARQPKPRLGQENDVSNNGLQPKLRLSRENDVAIKRHLPFSS